MTTIRLLYFAWLRQKIGRGEEEIALPETVTTVSTLLDWLTERGPEFENALLDRKAIKVAVNQDYASVSTPLKSGDEVALFPPVTGG